MHFRTWNRAAEQNLVLRTAYPTLVIILLAVANTQAAFSLSAGTFLWADPMGGATGSVAVTSMATDSQGNVCVVGNFRGTVDFDPGPQVRNLTPFGDSDKPDVFIMQLDRFGDLAWVRQIGGRNDDVAFAVAIDRDRDVYVAGSYLFRVDFDPGPGTFFQGSDTIADTRVFVLKLTNSGDFSYALDIGGEVAFSIAVDKLENVYLTGYFIDPGDFDPSGAVLTLTRTSGSFADLFVMRISSGRRTLWARNIGASNFFAFGQSVGVDDSGNVYVMGPFDDTMDFDPGLRVAEMKSSGETDAFVVKLDTRGNFVWARQLGGESELSPSRMSVDGKGICSVAGSFEGESDFDPGAADFVLSAPENSISGFLAQVNASGKFVQARAFVPNGKGLVFPENVCLVSSVATDPNGNIYVAGQFDSPFDFDPGPAEFVLAPVAEEDAFAVKLSRKGKFIWAGQFAGNDAQFATAVAADFNENFIVAGGFLRQTMDADPGSETFLLDPIGSNGDMFVVKLSGVPPRVQSFLRGSPSPTNLDVVSYSITFTQAVTGVDASDFLLTANGVTGAAITNVIGAGASYRVLVNTGTGNGDLSVDFIDNDSVVNIDFDPVGDFGVRNGNKFGPTYVIDRVLPTVTMSSDAPDPTSEKRIHVIVTVPQDIFGLTKDDIVLGNAKVKNFAGSGAAYAFDLVALSEGLVTADIPQGAAVDEAGNDTQAAVQLSRVYQP